MIRGLLCALLLTIGCSGGPPPQWSAATQVTSDYDDVLDTWTRDASHYENLQGQVFVKATCFSPAFAQAYSIERARRQGLPKNEAALLRRELVRAAESEARFFITLSTYNDHWNDLESPKSSIRLRLFHGQGENFIEPLRIERVPEDELADLRIFFPYSTPLSIAYVVIFPAPPQNDHLRLRVAGPPAVIDLEWHTQ